MNDVMDKAVPLNGSAKILSGHAHEVKLRTDCNSVYDTVYHHKRRKLEQGLTVECYDDIALFVPLLSPAAS